MEYDEIAVESRRLLLTYFMGLTKKKRAPQKVKPKPMNAKICEFSSTEKIRDKAPGIMKAMPIFPEGTPPLTFRSSDFRISMLSCCC